MMKKRDRQPNSGSQAQASATAAQLVRQAYAIHQQGQLAQAEVLYRNILQSHPRHFDTLHLLAIVALQRGKPQDAAGILSRAIQINPNQPDAHLNLGNALQELDRIDESLASCNRAIQIKPEFAEAFNGRANTLRAAGRDPEALVDYDRALQIKPDYAEAFYNRGNTLLDLGRQKEGLASYARALELNPDYAEVHWNEGLHRLLAGDYAMGWQKFEWRFKFNRSLKLDFGLPIWQGEELNGKTILLTSEQGLGDILQFVRYAPLVARQNARVTILAPKPLQRLLSFMDGIAQVVADDDLLPPCDLSCPILSLPHRFDTRLQTVPAHVPYLRPDQHDVSVWRERMARDSGQGSIRVGLVWAGRSPRESGNERYVRMDSRRSLRLQQLEPLAQVAGVLFYSLQKGEPAAQASEPPQGMRLIDHTGCINDFADTAAFIMNLDLVISVDTSVAHLAGALGKPVWLLNRFDTCWRWLVGRADSPWYPTMRVFRQQQPGQWASVVAEVGRALDEFKSQGGPVAAGRGSD